VKNIISGAGTAYPFGAPEFTPAFSETKSTKTKRNKTKRNQRNENEIKTKPTEAKRNQRNQNEPLSITSENEYSYSKMLYVNKSRRKIRKTIIDLNYFKFQ
jgi:hypothetical protein